MQSNCEYLQVKNSKLGVQVHIPTVAIHSGSSATSRFEGNCKITLLLSFLMSSPPVPAAFTILKGYSYNSYILNYVNPMKISCINKKNSSLTYRAPSPGKTSTLFTTVPIGNAPTGYASPSFGLTGIKKNL